MPWLASSIRRAQHLAPPVEGCSSLPTTSQLTWVNFPRSEVPWMWLTLMKNRDLHVSPSSRSVQISAQSRFTHFISRQHFWLGNNPKGMLYLLATLQTVYSDWSFRKKNSAAMNLSCKLSSGEQYLGSISAEKHNCEAFFVKVWTAVLNNAVWFVAMYTCAIRSRGNLFLMPPRCSLGAHACVVNGAMNLSLKALGQQEWGIPWGMHGKKWFHAVFTNTGSWYVPATLGQKTHF